MSWGDKMASVVWDVLGNDYDVIVHDERSFSITMYGEETILTRTSLFDLKSHWKKEISEALHIFFQKQINEAISKY